MPKKIRLDLLPLVQRGVRELPFATPVQHTFLLQGVLTCDECNRTFEPGSGTGKDGLVRFYYRHSRRAPKGCHMRSIPAEAVERLVIDRVNYLGNNIAIVEEIVAAATAHLQEEVPRVLRRLRERQARSLRAAD